ncbi:MAG: hypothetical protein HRT57_14190 [Crocinitomicaceae bacterium]|nr:hypothetical protein [Crocinitomicaceae bacterium]
MKSRAVKKNLLTLSFVILLSLMGFSQEKPNVPCNNIPTLTHSIVTPSPTKALSDINGIHPHTVKLCEADNGKLYGMTRLGGTHQKGTLFSFDPKTETYEKIIDFEGYSNGAHPYGSLLKTKNGLLYGTTNRGGACNHGTLFEFDTKTNTLTHKIDFDGWSGSKPNNILMEASNGKLYGMTLSGGIHDQGALFEYTPKSETIRAVINFERQVSGSNPLGGLIEVDGKRLIGMTQYGGLHNEGTIFEYNIKTEEYIKRVDLIPNVTGNRPHDNFVQFNSELLIGGTIFGGKYNKGTLFEYNINTHTFNKIHDFDGFTTGTSAKPTLILAKNNKLYGMTPNGGAKGYGTLFEYNPDTKILQKKLDFEGITNGQNPCGALTETNDGRIFGVTHLGGIYGKGIIFEYDIETNLIIKKYDFVGKR